MSQENLTTETYQGNDAKVKAARDIFKYVMLKLTNLRSLALRLAYENTRKVYGHHSIAKTLK